MKPTTVVVGVEGAVIYVFKVVCALQDVLLNDLVDSSTFPAKFFLSFCC